MLSLWPQPLPTPTTAHQRSQSHTNNTPLLSLSTWYAAKIPEIIRSAPNLPASLYGVITSILNIVNPYPPLPNELIHHIFTLAAVSDLESCRQLCLVSSWARLLVLPHLMPTVVIMKYKHWLLGPASSLTLNDQWVSPTLFTKHLWINDYREGDASDIDFRVAFSRCPNITHLSVAGRDLPDIARQNAHEFLPYTSRLIVQGCEKPFEHHIPLFSQITDLRLDLLPDQLESFDLIKFPVISHLTIDILALHESQPLLSLLSNLAQCTQPRKIILRLPSAGGDNMLFNDEGLTIVDIVTRASSKDKRLAISEEEVCLDWISWQAALEGRPIFEAGEQISY